MAPRGKKKELTHEEIWDDSALIDSWNEALAEYKVRNTSFLLTLSPLLPLPRARQQVDLGLEISQHTSQRRDRRRPTQQCRTGGGGGGERRSSKTITAKV